MKSKNKLPKPRKKQKYPELWMHKGSGDLIIHYDNEKSYLYRDSSNVKLWTWTLVPKIELDAWDIGLLYAWDIGLIDRDTRKADPKCFEFIGEIR
jgi:hypothetical protein